MTACATRHPHIALWCPGLGKTSLLQAGLFPALREEDYLPVPIRLDYLEGAAPLAAQVFGAITSGADAARVEAPRPRPAETLWEYFHREGNHFWSPRNDLVTPFLAFDQFEELFTLGRETPECATRATAFISELADLVENRPPAALRDDPLRAKEFSFKPAALKVLLAMREDYLAELDRIRPTFAPSARTACGSCRWASGRLAKSSPWVRRCLCLVWRIASLTLSLVAAPTPTPWRLPLPPRC